MLKGKVVVVTGGGGLIGREFVKAIVAQRGIAIIADVDTQAIESAKEKLQYNCDMRLVDSVELDITSKHSVKQAIQVLEKKYAKIDALINNAYPRNRNYGRHFFDVEYEDFVENLGMHLGGYFLASQQFAMFFSAQGYGNIVNISSIYGVMSPRFEVYEGTLMSMPVEYAAVKSALIHLTKYMAKAFKGKGIRVNAISPGGILDKQDERFLEAYKHFSLSKGMLDKGDLNGTLVFLLSEMSAYMNGQNLIVDDGYSL